MDAFGALTNKAIACAITVHRTLGPGLLESIYQDCLIVELRLQGLAVRRNVRVPVTYRGQHVGSDLRLDLLVDDQLVIEVKAVEHILPIHLAQVITYLKLTNRPVGLLMNFNTTALRNGLRRLEHPDRFAKKQAGTISGSSPPDLIP